MESNITPTQASRVVDAKNQCFNWFVQKVESRFTDVEISRLAKKTAEECCEMNIAMADYHHAVEKKKYWHAMIDEVTDAFTCAACDYIARDYRDCEAKDEVFSLFYHSEEQTERILKASMLYAPYKWFTASGDDASTPRFDIGNEAMVDEDHVSLTEVLNAYNASQKRARPGKLLVRIEVGDDDAIVIQTHVEGGAIE